MRNGRGKIFLEFANNFPLACDQEWLATFLSYQEETRLENEKTSQPRTVRVGCLVPRASKGKALGRGWLDRIELNTFLADGKYLGINEKVFFIAEVVVVVIRTLSPQYFLILPSVNFSSSTRG